MDSLTTAVCATLASDRKMAERIQEIIRKNPQLPEEYNFRYAEWLGNAILAEIGEDLSLRFDGAIPADGIHACLWETFVGSVDWEEVGKYFEEASERGKA
jgi:hypothetical protein